MLTLNLVQKAPVSIRMAGAVRLLLVAKCRIVRLEHGPLIIKGLGVGCHCSSKMLIKSVELKSKIGIQLLNVIAN